MRLMLRDDTALFRSNQQQTLQAIVRGETPVLQIAPTSAGKSASFMLPAFCSPKGVTVVIVPLLALQGDLQGRCIKSRISAEVWDRENSRTAQIVFVTPESAITKGFSDYLNRLAAQQRLDRVVVDECHIMLDSTPDFRPGVQRLGEVLALLGVQLLFLSATLQPRDEGRFFAVAQVRRSEAKIFRSRTTRPNISYRISTVAHHSKEDSAVVQEVESQLATHPNGRVIVYSGQINQVERLGRMLGCPVFHSKVASKKDKLQIVGDWKEEGGRVIVGTNALGLGLDVKDVRAVIHAGLPQKMQDYMQESGRGGRDGLPANSVVICSPNLASGSDSAFQVEEAMLDYLRSSEKCRRATIDWVMDRYERQTGCLDTEEACDFCQVAAAVAEAVDVAEEEEIVDENAAAIATEAVVNAQWQQTISRRIKQQEAQETADLREVFEAWSQRCAVCWVKKRVDLQHQQQQACGSEFGELWDRIEKTRSDLQDQFYKGPGYERFCACFKCGLPQEICDDWVAIEGDEGRFKKSGRGCQYKGLALRLIAAGLTLYKGQANRAIMAELDKKGAMHRGTEMGDILGKRLQWGGLATNWLTRISYICCIVME